MNQAYPVSSAAVGHAESALARSLLVASPSLSDPLFAQTLVLVVEAGPYGAWGVILNRPAPVDLAMLLDSAGIAHAGVAHGPVWLGGPVHPHSGLVLYADSPGVPHFEPDVALIPGLRMSSSMALLQAIGQGAGPDHFALYLGRTSWGAGQLEAELGQGLWLPIDADPDLVLHDEPARVWRTALASLGAVPAQVAVRPAQA